MRKLLLIPLCVLLCVPLVFTGCAQKRNLSKETDLGIAYEIPFRYELESVEENKNSYIKGQNDNGIFFLGSEKRLEIAVDDASRKKTSKNAEELTTGRGYKFTVYHKDDEGIGAAPLWTYAEGKVGDKNVSIYISGHSSRRAIMSDLRVIIGTMRQLD